MKKKAYIGHGEVGLFEVDALPSTAKKIQPTEDQLYQGDFKVAASEVRGNHHLVKLKEGVGIYEDTDGTIYIVNEQPTEVSCVDFKKHHTIEMPPKIWKRSSAREVDHLKQVKRIVAD